MNKTYISPHNLIKTHCLLLTWNQKVLGSPPVQTKYSGSVMLPTAYGESQTGNETHLHRPEFASTCHEQFSLILPRIF
jgi:hypothetical protein